MGFLDDLNVTGATTEEPQGIRQIAFSSSEPNAVTNPSDGMQSAEATNKLREHRVVQPADRVRRLASDSPNSLAQWFQTWIKDKKIRENVSTSTNRIRIVCLSLAAIATISTLWLMMPTGPHGPNNHRYPPRWEPGLEGSLPFRTWLQDLLLWTITTDLEPHRQAAAIIAQLGGAARELARTLSPQEIFNGGIVNGQHLDPVSFLIHGLSERFFPIR